MSTLFGKSKRKKKSRQVPIVVHENDTKPILLTTKTINTNSNNPSPEQNREIKESSKQRQQQQQQQHHISTFSDISLVPPLQQTCRSLGYKTPTPIQKKIIPFLLSNTSSHILALASTGSGKTASFVLPILHHLTHDPYGIYAVILTPTRELAKQIFEQVLALGSSIQIKACLIIGGMDMTKQACELSNKPHVCIATPGRLGALLRGPNPPILRNVKYVVLDEADRLLNAKSGFQGDVAEVLLHGTTTKTVTTFDGDCNGNVTFVDERKRRNNCQTLLFSATMTRSLESLEEMAGAGLGRLPLKKFVVNGDGDDLNHDNEEKKQSKKKRKKMHDDSDTDDSDENEDDENDENDENNESESDSSSSDSEDDGDDDNHDKKGKESLSLIPRIPPGLRQEYIFMPSHVRDAYLITAVRHLMTNGGMKGNDESDTKSRRDGSGWNDTTGNIATMADIEPEERGAGQSSFNKAKSTIIFVSTCERTALISGILTQLGVANVALHSLLTQNRRLASLAKFKSQQCRVLVATDVASRGLDIPTVDLVLNCELPRRSEDYIHRVGRTARAGRRGRAVSLVGERDVNLVHACEKISGRSLEKCKEVTDDLAVKMLSSVTKAARLTKMKLADIGFDELVKKMKERKIRDKKLREKAERAASRIYKKSKAK